VNEGAATLRQADDLSARIGMLRESRCAPFMIANATNKTQEKQGLTRCPNFEQAWRSLTGALDHHIFE
jgi:hypothetical protein